MKKHFLKSIFFILLTSVSVMAIDDCLLPYKCEVKEELENGILVPKELRNCRITNMPNMPINPVDVFDGKNLKTYFGQNQNVCDVLGWMNEGAGKFSDVGGMDLDIDIPLDLVIKHMRTAYKGGTGDIGNIDQNHLTLDSDVYIPRQLYSEKSYRDDGNFHGEHMKYTTVHEFFHILQLLTDKKYELEAGDNEGVDDPDRPLYRGWVFEGSARMFEDVVYDGENTYLSKSYMPVFEGDYIENILADSLGENKNIPSPSVHRYTSFLFWKFMQNNCKVNFKNIFGNYNIHFPNAANNCQNIPTVKDDKLAGAFVLYNWAMILYNDFSLIESDEPSSMTLHDNYTLIDGSLIAVNKFVDKFNKPNFSNLVDMKSMVGGSIPAFGAKSFLITKETLSLGCDDMNLTFTASNSNVKLYAVRVKADGSSDVNDGFTIKANDAPYELTNEDRRGGLFVTVTNTTKDPVSISGLMLSKNNIEVPEPNPGVVEVFLDWDNAALDYDLKVEWDAGEVDVKDTGCPSEHFHVLSEREIFPGRYIVSVVPKNSNDPVWEDNSTYPHSFTVTIKTPGASWEMEATVLSKQNTIEFGHAADIKIERVDDASNKNEDPNNNNGNDPTNGDSNPNSGGGGTFLIVPSVAPECPPVIETPSPIAPRPIVFPSRGSGSWQWSGGGSSSGGSYGGSTGGSSTPTTTYPRPFTPQQDHGCGGDLDCLPGVGDGNNGTGQDDRSGLPYPPYTIEVGGVPVRDIEEEDNCKGDMSCACIPCEYEIIPYLKQIYFGPLRDANFSIYTLDGYINKTSYFDGKTSNGNTLYDAGELDVPFVILNTLEDDRLYIIEAQGGEDIDYNDDFVVDATPTKNLGKVYAIASGKDIKYTGLKINILTTVTFELLRQSIEEGDTEEELESKINKIASRLLKYKVYPNTSESNISNVDLLAWLPTVDKDLLLRSYAPLKEMVRETYAGENIYEKAYEYVFYETPKVDEVNTTSRVPLPLDEVVLDASKPPIIKVLVASIQEDAHGGTVVGKIEILRGSDDVHFGQLVGKGHASFNINSEGEVTLADDVVLDYESKWLYKLQVQAINKNGSSAYVGVYISVKNVLDAPEYIKFEGGLVDENITGGTVVGKLYFNAGTSPISSIVMNGKSKGLFTVDITGVIRLAIGKSLDYEDTYSYGYAVIAKNDAGNSMPVILYINIRDIADIPKVTGYTGGYVHEDANVGTYVGQVLYSKGGSDIETIYLSGVGSEHFTIGNDGKIYVSNNATLDYETHTLYQPTVTVTNAEGIATKKIFISVIDTLDVPTFSTFTGGNVKENALIGAVVAQIVFDEGAMPIDSISLEGVGSEYFSVTANGTIVVAKEGLNYEEKYHYVLQVVASNSLGSSSPVTVHLLVDDVSEVPAVLQDFVVNNVAENLSVGSVIGNIVVLDEGSSAIVLYEISGNSADKFFVNVEGNVSIVKALDFETQETYNLKVKAKNGAGFGNEVNFIVRLSNVADVVGKIEDITFDIEENVTNGTLVGQAIVLDRGDSDVVNYVLRGSGSEKFDINSSGAISIKADNLFDYETRKTYNFQLIVLSEAGESLPALVNVNVLNIPDVVPTLHAQAVSLRIDENSVQDTLVGKIWVSSTGDSAIIGYHLSGEQNNHFIIDENANVMVSSLEGLDYEIKDTYVLGVSAENTAGKSLFVMLTIQLNDMIDDEPILDDTVLVMEENTTVGSIIGTIEINTIGKPALTAIKLEGIGSEKFSVNSEGEVKLLEAIDYEHDTKNYALTAIATNVKTNSEAVNVTIAILNVPEHPPVLKPLTLNILENTTIGTTVGQVEEDANAKVAGDSLIVSYRLDDTSTFRIDANGTISVNSALDYELQTSYTLVVSANNMAGKSAEVSVTIEILNRIERVPMITLQFIIPSLHDDIEVGTVVASVASSGSSIDENTVDGYSIISGNVNNIFAIDNDGAITIDKALNNSTGEDYTLEVIATNRAGNSMVITLKFKLLEQALKAFEIDKKYFLGNGIGESSVAIHSNTIAVGDSSQKTVTVYSIDSNSSVNELMTLRNEGGGYDAFGNALAVNNEYLVVGAKSDDTGAHDAGAIHIFRRESNGSMVKVNTLTGSRNYGNLGLSVALHTNLIAVGESSLGTTGRILLYKKDKNNNFYNYKVLDDSTNSTYFGNAIAIWGDYMVVGAKSDSEVAQREHCTVNPIKTPKKAPICSTLTPIFSYNI